MEGRDRYRIGNQPKRESVYVQIDARIIGVHWIMHLRVFL